MTKQQPLQPVFVKAVVHKTDRPTSRQRIFYRQMTDSEFPEKTTREEASVLIRKAINVAGHPKKK